MENCARTPDIVSKHYTGFPTQPLLNREHLVMQFLCTTVLHTEKLVGIFMGYHLIDLDKSSHQEHFGLCDLQNPCLFRLSRRTLTVKRFRASFVQT